MDRSIPWILCLPIFDHFLRSVLKKVGLEQVEFWLAMSDDDVESPDEKFSSFLPALTADDQVINAALMRLDMVNLLADMVSRSAKRVQEEIATDLGYGSAAPPRIGGKRPLPNCAQGPRAVAGREETGGCWLCGSHPIHPGLRQLGEEEMGPAAQTDL